MANILVTGGACYIGSHTCLVLAQNGYTPVAFDNLVHGHRELVQWGPFELRVRSIAKEFAPMLDR